MRWLVPTAAALSAAALGLTAAREQAAPGTAPGMDGGRAEPPVAADRDAAFVPVVEPPSGFAGDAGATATDGGPARRPGQRRRARPRVQTAGRVDYVGDLPGAIRVDSNADAGADAGTSAASAPPVADGGTAPDSGTAGSTQTDELRRRIGALEQQLAQGREQTSELQQLNEQLTALRQQLAESEQGRQDAQREAQLRQAEARRATSTLYSVQQTLAAGNGDVVEALSAVEPALPPPAQREVQAARAALSSGDLFQARVHVEAAIQAAQQRGN